MPKLFVSISHKGGTGRTVTSSNVAYHLALDGINTCCVDLDLTSPTLGAVLGLTGLERGAPHGTHDFLFSDDALRLSPDQARHEVISVWERRELKPLAASRHGAFDILPGKDTPLEVESNIEDLAKHLAGLFHFLETDYDIVFADLRSGLGAVTAAMLLANRSFALNIDAWLVFYRWTPQHLHGAADLCKRLHDGGARVLTVRTAYQDPYELSSSNHQKWFIDRNNDLTKLYNGLFAGRVDRIADIPFEPILQWDERILSISDKLASETTTRERYADLAQFLKDLV